MLVLLLGLVLFLGIHSIRIFAPEWRDSRLASMGEGPWKGVYSLVSLAGLGLLVWGYSLARPTAPDLYEPAAWMMHVNGALMLPALILVVSSDLKARWIKAAVKHPMLLAVKLWAFGHLLANGDLASVLLFGAFLVWAVADRISVKNRPADAVDNVDTSWSGRDSAAIVVGGLVYGLFVWKLHVWLFGAVPYAV